MRVIIPEYTSHFRRGDRIGTVVNTGWLKDLGPDRRGKAEIARVLLDRSQATVLVDLSDCSVINIGEAT